MLVWFGALLGHAFGTRYDAPVPPVLFITGGGLAVAASFLLVRRRPVPPATSEPPDDRPADPVPGPLAAVAASGSVLLLAALIAVGLLGEQDVSLNLLPVFFWLLVWVVLPLLVGLVGDFTRPVNPFAAVASAAGSRRLRRLLLGTGEPLPWPRRFGWWPAVLAFVLVVAGELIANRQATLPRVTAAGLLVYALACAAGALVFGAPAWCARAEVFSVAFAVWGRLGLFRFGAPGRPGPAGGLAARFAAVPSRVTFVLLLLVAVTFDGVLSTPQWARLTSGVAGSPVAEPAGLVAVTAVLLSGFGGFALAADRAAGRRERPLPALAAMLPSLLPIAYGYQLAHYLQYIAINGQLLVPLLADPMGRGWGLLPRPLRDYQVDATLLPTGLTWYLQIAVIVLAHVVAVLVAHQQLARRHPVAGAARRAEWVWLAAMVGYTVLSLWLLTQPLVRGPGESA